MRNFLGIPYPITQTPHGYLYAQSGINQIKSDLLVLLLTNPGERVMEPNFGTPLRKLIFDPNDITLQLKAKNMIIASINQWEPRIAITNISVTSPVPKNLLNRDDDRSEINGTLLVQILFKDPQNLKQVQDLTLEIPLAGG